MPKLSQDAFNARRARIVEAAVKCFAKHGIRVSVDEICAEAGVSKGALYGYFPSKDAIIQAIANEQAGDFGAIRAARNPARLRALLLQRIWDGEQAGCRLELEAWTYSLNADRLGAQLRVNLGKLRTSIEVALTEMQRAGAIELRVGAAEAATLIETFAMGGVAQAALADGEGGGEASVGLGLLFSILMQPVAGPPTR
jgi:AcrR family transcriptional regulator